MKNARRSTKELSRDISISCAIVVHVTFRIVPKVTENLLLTNGLILSTNIVTTNEVAARSITKISTNCLRSSILVP